MKKDNSFYPSRTSRIKTRHQGKPITIDITKSISVNHGPVKELIEAVNSYPGKHLLDFGCGRFRNSNPLAGTHRVIATDYAEAFNSGGRDGVTFLAWPSEFYHCIISPGRKFDKIMLAFVLQTMPDRRERIYVLEQLRKLIEPYGRLFYASTRGKRAKREESKYKDGWLMKRPNQKEYSFYTEWSAKETHAMFAKAGFEYACRYGNRGGDFQFFIYKPI